MFKLCLFDVSHSISEAEGVAGVGVVGVAEITESTLSVRQRQ